MSRALVEFAGINILAEASGPRLSSLLKDLREQFEEQRLEPDPSTDRAGRLAFRHLHQRIYLRLQEVEDAGSIANDVGVLVEHGTSLTFVTPKDARHDDGTFSAYKRHFVGDIPWLTVGADLNTTANALGVPSFQLDIRRLPGGEESDVTELVAPLLEDCRLGFLGLIAFHPLGQQTVALGTRAFRERALRLGALKVRQLENLVLEATVVDTEIQRTIGEEADADIFLEGASSSQPVLFHDLKGNDWVSRLRRHLGQYIAALCGNAAYAATFRVLLELDTSAQREAFLLECGVGPDEIKDVKTQLELDGLESREAYRRWWTSVFEVLEISADLSEGDASTRVESALRQSTVPLELRALLLKGRGTELIRRDVSPGGVLTALEAHGIDLNDLDSRLRALGDSGLQIRCASDLLRDWKCTYKRSVAWLLSLSRNLTDIQAKAVVETWQVPPHLINRITVGLSEVLEPVAQMLRDAGFNADAQQLAENGWAHLELLSKRSLEEVQTGWRVIYDAEERKRLSRDRALAWRRCLVPVVVAALTGPSDPNFSIRSEAQRVQRILPVVPEKPNDLSGAIVELLERNSELAEALIALLPIGENFDAPRQTRIDDCAHPFIASSEHLKHVQYVLKRGPREQIEHLQTQIRELKSQDLVPQVREGLKPPKPKTPKVSGKYPVKRNKVQRSQEHLNRLGASAEGWVLAAMLRSLLEVDFPERQRRIGIMIDALEGAYSGNSVQLLVARGREAVDVDADEEDQLESLAQFLHLSRESDEFGCDLLGWIAADSGEGQPVFLEVKSVDAKGFFLSAHEWARATELRDRYAIVAVLRGESASDAPRSMELLPDPLQLEVDKVLEMDTDTWRVRYG